MWDEKYFIDYVDKCNKSLRKVNFNHINRIQSLQKDIKEYSKVRVITTRNGSPVLILELGREKLDSNGVLGLTSRNFSHSSRVIILTVP